MQVLIIKTYGKCADFKFIPLIAFRKFFIERSKGGEMLSEALAYAHPLTSHLSLRIKAL